MAKDVYWFRGTIARLKAELELSGIGHGVHLETPVRAEIGLGYYSEPIVDFVQPVRRETNVTINAIEHDDGLLRLEVDNTNDPDWAALHNLLGDRLTETPPGKPGIREKTGTKKDHGNDAYSEEGRAEIAKEYWDGKKKGTVANQDAFAARYGIDAKTLRRYLNEFPE